MTKFSFSKPGQNLPVSFELAEGVNLPAPLLQVQRRDKSIGNAVGRWRSRQKQAAVARELAEQLEQQQLLRIAEVEGSRIDLATGKAKRELLKAFSSETAQLTRALFTETEAQTLGIDTDTHQVHVNRVAASKDMRKAAEGKDFDAEDLAELDAVIRHMRAEGLVNTMANREVAIADANDKFRKAVSYVERQVAQFDL